MNKYIKLDDVLHFLEINKDMLGFESTYDAIAGMPTVELPHWHDLRKNPKDLPKEDGKVLVRFDDGAMGFGEFIDCPETNGYGFNVSYLGKIVKWCELPKDED